MKDKQYLEDALMFNPFEGDFGCPEDRTLKDKIVKFRKQHTCHICQGDTEIGEVGRNIVSVFDGELVPFYFCNECCEAMVVSEEECNDDSEDDYDPYEKITKQYRLGEDRLRIKKAKQISVN